MALTPKQEAFAQNVAAGKTQADAYRMAYDCQKSSSDTIINKAHALMKNGDIKARVDELKQQLSEKALWTRQDSVKTLIEVLNDGNAKPSDKTAAIKVLNDMHGYNAPTEAKLDTTIRIIE